MPVVIQVTQKAHEVRRQRAEHLELLSGCDLIIEAIAEKMDWKNDLYSKIAPFLSSTAVIASNTSGLSINALAEGLPEALRPNF